ncbi:MAG: hypothetical protein LAP85_15335 [Acidobacteriia bacterium]|nr:hypothetical protein [Terriglobia bacterium]
MSVLAALAAKTANDEEFLGKINDALLQLQLEAAGKASELGYKNEDLEASRKILCEFLDILANVIGRAQRRELSDGRTQAELAAENILSRLDEQGKPREDWVEDIGEAIQRLRVEAPIEAADWALLEQLIDFLDTELAQDLVALSKA